MKITVEVSEINEATAYPWWAIINGGMNSSIAGIAFRIIGPFFSRESAQRHLDAKRHRYSPKAEVWCLSGNDSNEYRAAMDVARMSK